MEQAKFNQNRYTMKTKLKITKNINADILLSSIEVANLFCSMDEEQQAEFFNAIGENVGFWNAPFVFQLQAMIDTGALTEKGKRIMKEIGEYSNAELSDLKSMQQ